MFAKLSYFINDFWYIGFFYLLFLSYFLLILHLVLQQKWLRLIKIAVVNLLVFLIMALQLSYGLEIYFRYIFDQTDSFGSTLTNQRWKEKHIDSKGEVISPEFFRDTKSFHQSKKAGEKRIAVVGDSISYGLGIENIADRFSNQLETKLQQKGYPVNIFNFSQPGVNFPGEKKFFELIASQNNFDLIIWQSFMNDFPTAPSPALADIKKKIYKNLENPLFKDLYNKSFAFNHFYSLFLRGNDTYMLKHINHQMTAFNDDKVLSKANSQVEAIASITKTKKIPTIIIIFPYIHLLGDNYSAIQGHQQLTKIFEKNEFLVIDLLNKYQNYTAEKLMVNKYDSHPNELANKLAAEELYKFLISSNYIQYLE